MLGTTIADNQVRENSTTSGERQTSRRRNEQALACISYTLRSRKFKAADRHYTAPACELFKGTCLVVVLEGLNLLSRYKYEKN